MRHKFPRQIVVLLVILVITCASLVYVFSCREKVAMQLDTYTGDTQSLVDRQMSLRLASFGYSTHSSILDLEISFDGNPVLERIAYDQEIRQAVREGRFDLFYEETDQSKAYTFEYSSTGNPSYHVSGLAINDESDSLLEAANPEADPNENLSRSINYTGDSPTFFEMNGIEYFTIPNLKQEIFTYYVRRLSPSGEIVNSAVSQPVEYTASSGIWAIDTANGGVPQNVSPFAISSDPESPRVYTIYPVEEQEIIILLTVENGVDLYATLYDAKTGIAQDPVQVFHSESGDIIPILSRKNNSCPMGSIIVKMQEDESKCYAVALQKDEGSGEITAASYDISTVLDAQRTAGNGTYHFVDYADSYASEEYSEIFYMGDEMWIISEISDEYDDEDLTLDHPDFPFTSQSTQQFRIEGWKTGEVLYQGVLSIDLTAADTDASLYSLGNVSVAGPYRNDMATWVEFS